jgi:hypothetical protein
MSENNIALADNFKAAVKKFSESGVQYVEETLSKADSKK